MDSRKPGTPTEAMGELLTRRSALGWLAAAAITVGLTNAGSAEARNNRRGRNGRGGRGHGGRKNGRNKHRNGRN